MQNFAMIPVGVLNVVSYVPVDCPRHKWALTIQPVTRCAYFRCVLYNDRMEYERYADLVEKREVAEKGTPKFRTDSSTSYDAFLKKINDIRADGGFRLEKSSPAIRYHKGRGNDYVLMDGHRRCSIICALFGTEARVAVEQGDDPLNDIDQCCRAIH